MSSNPSDDPPPLLTFSPRAYFGCIVHHDGHDWHTPKGTIVQRCRRCHKRAPSPFQLGPLFMLVSACIYLLIRGFLCRHLNFDRRAVELAILLLFVAGAAAVITMPAPAAVDTSPEQIVGDVTGSESGNEAATGIGWVVLEVAFAIALIAAIFLSRRLPGWFRTALKRLGIASAIYVYGVASAGDGWGFGLIVMAGIYLGYRITDRFGVYWAINNVLSIVVAIAFGVVLGGFLGVVGFAAALVALTAYDYYFADRKSVMFDLADFILRLRVPVIFVRPAGAQLRWGDLLGGDLSDEDDTPGLAWGIGTADLLVGAAFIAALTTTGSFMGVRHSAGVIGIVLAGLALSSLRLSHKLETKDGGAGLPAITAGLLLPYTGVVALSLVVGWAV